jgi:hypothetical protein
MVFRVVQQSLDTGLRERPCSGVEGFFLTPDYGLGIGVHVEVFFQLLPWEGVQLFDASDGGVFETVVGAVLVEGDVDLAGTEDDALDLFGIIDGFAVLGVGNDPLELRVTSKFLNGRSSKRVAEE